MLMAMDERVVKRLMAIGERMVNCSWLLKNQCLNAHGHGRTSVEMLMAIEERVRVFK